MVKRFETVRVRLLGGFRVSVGSRTIEKGAWRRRKAAALVKVLALAPSHRVHREQVMELLWPDSGRRAASNNLRQALHAARRALDLSAGSRYLASADEMLLTLCPESGLWVDVDAFEEAARAARRVAEPPAYEAAIALYAGELLPEDRYEQWAENRREELRRLFHSLLVELAQVYEESGDYGRGIEALRRVISEGAYPRGGARWAHALVRLLWAAEECHAAVRAASRGLSRELVAEPTATTRRLHEDISAGGLAAPTLQPTAGSTAGRREAEPRGPASLDEIGR